ncbi:hypothetical protein KIN20_005330 [Parelaphostrongylus tenuis]|uniref:Uncharacterized protein n=1 Tax=Parelaphostrongylus tenuis TaxID=148309 RepID=A0AAD5MSL9_PARTN|nr:hypothetical protein KIN20_005330 [Parelaphostrongylus tenuis]
MDKGTVWCWRYSKRFTASGIGTQIYAVRGRDCILTEMTKKSRDDLGPPLERARPVKKTLYVVVNESTHCERR